MCNFECQKLAASRWSGHTRPQNTEVENGEAELRLLCERFMIPMSQLKREYRELKASLRTAKLRKLRPVTAGLLLLVCVS